MNTLERSTQGGLLTIGDLAQRTGVSPATLRMWEQRHGFPVPTRLASGHRRYRSTDAEVVADVLRGREDGVRLDVAIERAVARSVARARPPATSVFAELGRRHPQLAAHRLRKASLIALSWAIEDEFCAKATRPHLFGAFQRPVFYESSRARWREFARVARSAYVFADFGRPDDPDDPIRRQVIPVGSELRAFTGMMEDSLAEDRHSPVPGLVHRYPDRVLMLITTQCASYCRYCTRSRIVGDATQNFNRREHEAQLDYIRRTPQIRDVLISGGDGLTLAPRLLESVLRGLREIPHVEIVRIGSRVPVFLPQRIDEELGEMLAKYHPVWMNIHVNHPNEMTPELARACDTLTRAGIPLGNQSVLLAGVNDCVHVQRELVQRASKPARLRLQDGAAGGERRVVVARCQPAVGQCLLDDDANACLVRGGQRAGERRLEDVPGSLDGVEEPHAVALDGHRPFERLARAGPAQGQPDGPAALGAQRRQRVEHVVALEDAGVERRRVDLIQGEPPVEDRGRLAGLTLQGRQRVILDLVDVGVHRPARGIGVAPLRADGQFAALALARPQPVREELLSAPIGTRRVDVADAGGPGGVEHRGGMVAHRGHVIVALEVGGVAEVDIARPAERRQSQTQPAHAHAGPAENSPPHPPPFDDAAPSLSVPVAGPRTSAPTAALVGTTLDQQLGDSAHAPVLACKP